MLVLYGWHPREGELQQFFTLNEKDTALAIAKTWQERNWQPVLLQKSYNGKFRFLFSYRNKKAA
jgi:hypothetical protein